MKPQLLEKNFYKQTRGDGTALYFAEAVFVVYKLFGFIPIKLRLHVHKVDFDPIYYLSEIKSWRYGFDDLQINKK